MSIIGVPLPLLAIHILWINLVTDGLPALALGVDPTNPDIMKRKPNGTDSNIIDKGMTISIVVISIIITIAVIIFFLKWYQVDLSMARTGVMLLLVFLELMRGQMIRSDYGIGIFSNRRLIGALLLSIILVLMIVYTPLSLVFQTTIPSADMWIDIGLFVATTTVVGFAIDHIIDRRWAKKCASKMNAH